MSSLVLGYTLTRALKSRLKRSDCFNCGVTQKDWLMNGKKKITPISTVNGEVTGTKVILAAEQRHAETVRLHTQLLE